MLLFYCTVVVGSTPEILTKNFGLDFSQYFFAIYFYGDEMYKHVMQLNDLNACDDRCTYLHSSKRVRPERENISSLCYGSLNPVIGTFDCLEQFA